MISLEKPPPPADEPVWTALWAERVDGLREVYAASATLGVASAWLT